MYHPDTYIAEKDEELPATETASHGTRKPTTRAERRASTRKAKRHLRQIEPLTMSVRQTRNGGIIRKGDTYSWLPEWKKADHRTARHAGKTVCNNYSDIPEREIPNSPDIDPCGYWDAESQEFIPDFRKRDLRRLVSEVEAMTFPAILTGEISYDVTWGVYKEFSSLGLIESVEEGKEAVKFLVNEAYSDEYFEPECVTVKANPVKGSNFFGYAHYEE